MLDTDGIGAINPVRYRSYYYDIETGFYYLQTRYYDPETGRFINADDVTLLGANGDFASYNLFAYCGNNPAIHMDVTGYFWKEAWHGLVDYFERIIAIQQQSQALDTQIRMQQNDMLHDAAKSIWDAYMRSVELKQQAQLQNSLALIEGIEYLTSDVDSALGFATVTASMYSFSSSSFLAIAGLSNPLSALGCGVLALISLYLYIKGEISNS